MAPISDLCAQARTYLDPGQVEAIYRAYLLGAEAHRGQQRATGDPYITHPVEVARVLVGMRLDTESVIAGMLHDVMEDTSIGKERIARDFGKEVADLVDGVTKLSQIEATSRVVAQAENYRKMLLAMTDDVRVMLVKLADRLHNMRTIDALATDRRRRIARETLEIYAPIAIRLGLNHVKEELEDLGFRALYPNRYRVIQAELRRTRGNRKRAVKNVQTAIRRRLRQEGLAARGARPREAHLQRLPEDAQQAPSPGAGARRVRHPHPGGQRRHVLPGARVGAQPLQAEAGPVQGLHRHPEGEWLPVAAHGAVRTARAADRNPDPEQRDARNRGVRNRRPRPVQGRERAEQRRPPARPHLDARDPRDAEDGRGPG